MKPDLYTKAVLTVIAIMLIVIAGNSYLNPAQRALAQSARGPTVKPQSTSGAYGRSFYLTKETVLGDAALKACASGYHMAAMPEIENVGGLQYEPNLGLVTSDSGFGPPVESGMSLPAIGWVRSGVQIQPQTQRPGCNLWTSQSHGDDGTAVFLRWKRPTTPPLSSSGVEWFGQWYQNSLSTIGMIKCDLAMHVWCVKD